MFAYVKNLTPGLTNPYAMVHTSRIFHYVAPKKRCKFDPEKFDVKVTYGIAIRRDLVKHQVLLVAATERDLKKLVSPQEKTRLRSVPCPKRHSTGPISEPLKLYQLMEEAEVSKGADSKQAKARKKVETIRNKKISQALDKQLKEDTICATKASVSSVSNEEEVLEPKRKKLKANDSQDDVTNSVVVDVHIGSKDNESSDKSQITTAPNLRNDEKNQESPKNSILTTSEGHCKPISKEQDAVMSSKQCEEQDLREQQLQLALKELDIYRQRCSELEEKQKNDAEIVNRLRQIEIDIQDIKEFMATVKEKGESRKLGKQTKVCQLSLLTDVAPCPDKDYQIPNHCVHMGDGIYFIKKVDLVKAEKAKGLRPRLKKLLTLMYKDDLCHWYVKQKGRGQDGKEIPERHIQSFIGVLEAMVWKKSANLELEHVTRETSKALYELRKVGFSADSDIEEGEVVTNDEPVKHCEEEGLDENNDVEDLDENLSKSFHEEDEVHL